MTACSILVSKPSTQRHRWRTAREPVGARTAAGSAARLMAVHGIRGATRAKKRFTTKANPAD